MVTIAVIERDVILISKDADGNETIDYPLARLGNIEGNADVKAADYIPLMDSSDRNQMKKVKVGTLIGNGNTITDDTPVKTVTRAEYDALSEAEKQADILYIITDDNSSGGSSNDASEEIYSTEETRIGTWIDGKPLYRIVVETELRTGSNAVNTNLYDASPLNIKSLIKMDGLCTEIISANSGSTDYAEPLNHFYSTSSYGAFCMNKSKMIFGHNVGRTYCKVRLILEYTKTTD